MVLSSNEEAENEVGSVLRGSKRGVTLGQFFFFKVMPHGVPGNDNKKTTTTKKILSESKNT